MRNLTWLQALLIVAHERRATIDEAAALLRSGKEFTTFPATFSPWRTPMYDTVERLIADGHADRVREAGKFAEAKTEWDVTWTPADEHPANELFHAINECNDDDELADIAEFISDMTCDDPIAA